MKLEEIKQLQNQQIMHLQENNPLDSYIEEITARKEQESEPGPSRVSSAIGGKGAEKSSSNPAETNDSKNPMEENTESKQTVLMEMPNRSSRRANSQLEKILAADEDEEQIKFIIGSNSQILSNNMSHTQDFKSKEIEEEEYYDEEEEQGEEEIQENPVK